MGRGRADHEHGVLVDEVGHGVGIGPPVVAHRHLVELEAEVERPLVERSVGRLGHDHLGLVDVALLAALLPCSLDRHEDALGAT
jgi:hypothetical protein